jgi:hypothetical protein
MKKYDTVSAIMEFESGKLSVEKIIELFAELIKTGMAWSLQGSYGRMAARLIEAGYIDRQGKILKTIEDL